MDKVHLTSIWHILPPNTKFVKKLVFFFTFFFFSLLSHNHFLGGPKCHTHKKSLMNDF